MVVVVVVVAAVVIVVVVVVAAGRGWGACVPGLSVTLTWSFGLVAPSHALCPSPPQTPWPQLLLPPPPPLSLPPYTPSSTTHSRSLRQGLSAPRLTTLHPSLRRQLHTSSHPARYFPLRYSSTTTTYVFTYMYFPPHLNEYKLYF